VRPDEQKLVHFNRICSLSSTICIQVFGITVCIETCLQKENAEY